MSYTGTSELMSIKFTCQVSQGDVWPVVMPQKSYTHISWPVHVWYQCGWRVTGTSVVGCVRIYLWQKAKDRGQYIPAWRSKNCGINIVECRTTDKGEMSWASKHPHIQVTQQMKNSWKCSCIFSQFHVGYILTFSWQESWTLIAFKSDCSEGKAQLHKSFHSYITMETTNPLQALFVYFFHWWKTNKEKVCFQFVTFLLWSRP